MIWGEVVNFARSLHLQLFAQVPVAEAVFHSPFVFKSPSISFPQSAQSFSDWHALPVPELLELHPVERHLLEGPLLPVEEINPLPARELENLLGQILILEQEWWGENLGQESENLRTWIEVIWKAEWVRFQKKFGYSRLKAV